MQIRRNGLSTYSYSYFFSFLLQIWAIKLLVRSVLVPPVTRSCSRRSASEDSSSMETYPAAITTCLALIYIPPYAIGVTSYQCLPDYLPSERDRHGVPPRAARRLHLRRRRYPHAAAAGERRACAQLRRVQRRDDRREDGETRHGRPRGPQQAHQRRA